MLHNPCFIYLLLISPHDLLSLSADRRETWPPDVHMAEFYDVVQISRGRRDKQTDILTPKQRKILTR